MHQRRLGLLSPSPQADEREGARLAALADLNILDTLPEDVYDCIVRLIANICGTPIGLVSLVDADRQWFKSRLGLAACETSRDSSFCAHAIESPGDVFVIADALADPRFRNNPLVVGEPHIRFYAGMPLTTRSGHAIGSVCVIDRVPRILGERQLEALRLAARMVMELFEKVPLRSTTGNGAGLFRTVANAVNQLIMILLVPADLDQPSTLEYVNETFTRVTSYAAIDVVGQPIEKFWREGRAQARTLRRKLARGVEFVSIVDGLFNGATPQVFEARFSPLETDDADGRWLVVLHETRPSSELADSAGSSDLAATNALLRRELARRTQLEEQLRAADGLTNLPNRHAFESRLQRMLSSSAGSAAGPAAAVLIVDVDHFKQINDTYGQATGDELLQRLALRLAACARIGDIVARSGGNAFALLMGSTSVSEAEGIAGRILTELSTPCVIGGSRIVPTASIGICMVDASYSSSGAVLRDADTAMFHAKDRGRKRFEFFRPELRVQSMAQAELDLTLYAALEQQKFRLVYQPIMSLDAGRPRLDAFETLLRLDDAAGVPINPAEMIGRAENTGLIVPLGEWIVETACMQLVKWSLSGPAPTLSINVSPKQLVTGTFISTVKRCIGYSGVDPRRLAFELTESALMEDPDAALKSLEELRQLGSKVYLDDFGTGYSSLNYLRRFKIDRLKIDRAFVSAKRAELEDPVIVEAIVTLAHRLGIETVAEGVETPTQLRALVEMGADAGQGYLFSPGVPAMRAAAFLADERTLLERIDG